MNWNITYQFEDEDVGTMSVYDVDTKEEAMKEAHHNLKSGGNYYVILKVEEQK